MGIGGISMSGLAEILIKEGFKVTGSDMKASNMTDKLSDMGALINIGQTASNITDQIDLVVYTAAIHPDNEEFQAAKAKNIPMLTRAQLLGQIMTNYKYSVAVSGTHGKTTTTAMLSYIMLEADVDPTISVGGIIDDTVAIRDRFFPDAKIAVLSNSTMLHKEEVFQALNKIEDNILKLDSVLDSRIRQIDVPNSPAFNFESLLKQLCRFNGNLIIQTMFLKGEVNGKSVNNMTEEEIAGWISALKQIRPKQVMIYTIDRETPVKALKKATKEELDAIAERARKEGFDVTVSY